MKSKMAHMRLLRQPFLNGCVPGLRLGNRAPSSSRFRGTVNSSSTTAPLGRSTSDGADQEGASAPYVRKTTSTTRNLMDQLDDLNSQKTAEPPQKPTPKELWQHSYGRQKQRLLRRGVEPGMTASAISKDLFPSGSPGDSVRLNPLYLRDACDCHQCIDRSTRQRNYSFTEIPFSIKPVLKEIGENHTYHVTWENDVAGFDESHISLFPAARIEELIKTPDQRRGNPRLSKLLRSQLWDKVAFTDHGCHIEYEDYMNNTSSLKQAVSALRRDGLIFVENVPPDASSVSKVAERIGSLRNTFYGLTWDVRSVANAKNVAYTSKYLGFHMDLLYMDSPPDFQLLHCIHNSCAGGESRFVDTYNAARILHEQAPKLAQALRQTMVKYTYNNDGHYYTHSHKVFDTGTATPMWLSADNSVPTSWKDEGTINWSPEFMDSPGIERMDEDDTRQFLAAARLFAEIMEREDLVYQIKMEEGTCVIFENRRVAHARNAFEMQTGERWLRGAYLDYDVFWSKYKVLGAEENHWKP